MIGKVLAPRVLLYTLTVVLTIAFAAVSDALGDPYVELQTPAKGKVDFAVSVITFHRTVLAHRHPVLYTLLILMAGPLLLAHRPRSYTGGVLAAPLPRGSCSSSGRSGSRAHGRSRRGFRSQPWQADLRDRARGSDYHRERLAPFLKPRALAAFGVACVLVLVAVQLSPKR